MAFSFLGFEMCSVIAGKQSRYQQRDRWSDCGVRSSHDYWDVGVTRENLELQQKSG